MNICTEKLQLIEQLSTTTDEDLLVALRSFLQFTLNRKTANRGEL